MRDTDRVRARINVPLALERISNIDMPILVLGRDGDELQGIFRLSYELLEESGKEATWLSWDHPLHGYIFPVSDAEGHVNVDAVQRSAIDNIIEFLDRHMKSVTS